MYHRCAVAMVLQLKQTHVNNQTNKQIKKTSTLTNTFATFRRHAKKYSKFIQKIHNTTKCRKARLVLYFQLCNVLFCMYLHIFLNATHIILKYCSFLIFCCVFVYLHVFSVVVACLALSAIHRQMDQKHARKCCSYN